MNGLQRRSYSFCSFCDNFEIKIGGSTEDFLKIYPRLSKIGQVIKIYRNFILITDIAPITQDHLLLISKNHFPSFASIPKGQRLGFKQSIEEIIQGMKEFHPNSEIFVFEHGVGKIGEKIIRCGTCGRTEHAHLHILPIPNRSSTNTGIKLAKEISRSLGLKLRIIPPLPKLNLEFVVKKYPYLYLWSSNGEQGYVLVQTSSRVFVPSQVIRKFLLIKFFNPKEMIYKQDWRNYIFSHKGEGEQMILKTLNRWFSKKV